MTARNMTAAALAEINEATVKPIMLFEGEFLTGTVNVWTGYGTLSWDGKSWTGLGNLIGISELSESSDIVANGMTFTLSAVDASLVSLAINEARQGKPGRLWIGFLDDSGELLLNGGFRTSIDGWTDNNATGSWDGGRLKVVTGPAANYGSNWQAVTTVIGVNYTLSGDLLATNDRAWLQARDGPTGASGILAQAFNAATTPGSGTDSFNATGTTTWIHCYSADGVGDDSLWDNISLKPTAPGSLPQVIADPYKCFNGFLDVPTIQDGAETCTLQFTYENALIDMQRPRTWRYTHESQKQLFPDDLGFEYVASIQDLKITWGT